MLVTTAGRTNETMIINAKNVANELETPYITRNKLSTAKLHEQYKDDIFVVGKDRYEIFPFQKSEPLFFHPNSAMFRLKRVLRGESDPFLEATNLQKGERFLDCTLGLASESILASYIVGENGVSVGLEGNRYLAYLVKHGLLNWEVNLQEMKEAMQRINVINSTYEEYLKQLPTDSFDVVYFDPMFDDSILNSDGIKGIKHLAIFDPLHRSALVEAKRVSKKRVVMKAHWQSNSFQELGFTVQKRQSAKFHYGVIDC